MRRARAASRRTVAVALATLALAVPGMHRTARAAGAAARDAAASLSSARVIALRLRASGRAVASLERRAEDPVSGRTRVIRGRLALEPPDRALLEFPDTGERIALRGDGGEWLQPALSQLLRLGPRNAAAGMRWWALLLPGGAARFGERAISARRYAVISPAGGEFGADTAWVSLDPRGLPSRLEFGDATGGRVTYRFSGWRFERPLGRMGFVLEAPKDCSIVDLP